MSPKQVHFVRIMVFFNTNTHTNTGLDSAETVLTEKLGQQRHSVNIKRVDCYRDGDNELEGAGQPVMTSLAWLWDGNKWSLAG